MPIKQSQGNPPSLRVSIRKRGQARQVSQINAIQRRWPKDDLHEIFVLPVGFWSLREEESQDLNGQNPLKMTKISLRWPLAILT